MGLRKLSALRGLLGLTFVFGLALPVHAQVFQFWKKPCDNCYTCPPATITEMPGSTLPDSKGITEPKIQMDPIEPALDPVTTAALGGGGVAMGADAGYIDNALPFSHIRLRFDSAFDNNVPDRAEFFYPKCGCFRVAGIDPNAKGPPLPETNVDYQDISAYLEIASQGRYSAFVEVPYRMLNPQANANASGFGDMKAGFKAALWSCPDKLLTFQLRTYIPTGDGGRGLGTQHVSIEPALLFNTMPTKEWSVFGEVAGWLPIGGSDFAGNVMIYGVGTSYTVYETCKVRVAPVVEMLGWTALGGREFDPNIGNVSAYGDTIANAKVGVRIGWGDSMGYGLLGTSSLYLGYGRALTGERWYQDIYRVEYRMSF